MANINYDFYSGNDIYNDGEIEAKLLELYKNGKKIDSNNDGFFYLTTDIRSNILNWYPFTKKDSILEIGCGCGTITGVLTEKCGSVISVDGSKRRAEITYNRHKDKDNLIVYAGNFQDIEYNKKFDYVVIIGVFEYAKQFFDSDSPFECFIENIKKLLLPTGKILIAIENRYGIKYWAGSDEDHLYMPYVGLEGYEKYNVQTFGKKELIELFSKYGFVKNKFFYPFPDYKLPFVVYSDDRLPNLSEVSSIPIYTYGNNVSFNIHKVLDGIIKNDMFGFFSNSFLVEFGYEDSVLSDVVYAKNSDKRTIDYKITTIEDSNGFYKIPCSNNSKKHLDNVVKNHKELKKCNIEVCDFFEKNDRYYSDKIDGCCVAEYICKLAEQGNWNLVDKEIDKIVDFYYSISEMKSFDTPIIDDILKIYGKKKTHILNKSLIDGNISNVFIKNNKYIFIDQEWIIDKQLPADYLIFFSLVYLYHSCDLLNNHLSLEECLIKYNISDDKVKLFNKIEKYFYNDYKNIIDTYKEKNMLGCLLINNCNSKTCVFYIDTGNDFNENEKYVCTYKNGKNSNEYTINLELPTTTRRVRFDPIFPGNQRLYFSNLKVNGKKIDYECYNIDEINEKKCLINKYPFVVFDFTSNSLNLSVNIDELSEDEFNQYLNMKEDISNKYYNQCEINNNLLCQINSLNGSLKNKTKECNILNDKCSHLEKNNKNIELKNKKMMEQCKNLKDKIKYDGLYIKDLESSYNKIEKKYSKTLRCKLGKIIKKI